MCFCENRRELLPLDQSHNWSRGNHFLLFSHLTERSDDSVALSLLQVPHCLIKHDVVLEAFAVEQLFEQALQIGSPANIRSLVSYSQQSWQCMRISTYARLLSCRQCLLDQSYMTVSAIVSNFSVTFPDCTVSCFRLLSNFFRLLCGFL